MRCSEFLPTMVACYLEFRGWIRHGTRCNGMSVTFELSQSLALGNGFIEAMRGISNCRLSSGSSNKTLCGMLSVSPVKLTTSRPLINSSI